MNPRDHDARDDFDARLRRHYGDAVEHVSPRTRAGLAVRHGIPNRARSAAPTRPAWWLASACAIGALALGLVWRLQPPSTPARASAEATSAELASTGAAPAATASVEASSAALASWTGEDDAYAVYDESPDLYLWLGSDDAAIALD